MAPATLLLNIFNVNVHFLEVMYTITLILLSNYYIFQLRVESFIIEQDPYLHLVKTHDIGHGDS